MTNQYDQPMTPLPPPRAGVSKHKIIARPTHTLSQYGFSESSLGKPMVGPEMGNDYRRANGLPINGGLQGLREMQQKTPTNQTNPGDGSMERFVEHYITSNGGDPKNPEHDKMARAQYFLLPSQERAKWATPATAGTEGGRVTPSATSAPASANSSGQVTSGLVAPSGSKYPAFFQQPATPTLKAPAPPANAEGALMAQGLQMQQRGLKEMGPNTRTFKSGATITQTAPGVNQPAVLQSPYGTGSVTFKPAPVPQVSGQMPPPVLTPPSPSYAAPIGTTGALRPMPRLPTGNIELSDQQKQDNNALANTIKGRPLNGMKSPLPGSEVRANLAPVKLPLVPLVNKLASQ